MAQEKLDGAVSVARSPMPEKHLAAARVVVTVAQTPVLFQCKAPVESTRMMPINIGRNASSLRPKSRTLHRELIPSERSDSQMAKKELIDRNKSEQLIELIRIMERAAGFCSRRQEEIHAK